MYMLFSSDFTFLTIFNRIYIFRTLLYLYRHHPQLRAEMCVCMRLCVRVMFLRHAVGHMNTHSEQMGIRRCGSLDSNMC